MSLFNGRNIKMPNDATIVAPTTGRLTQAYTYYLGYIETIGRALIGITPVTASAQTWMTVASADLSGASTTAQIATFCNEVKADLNSNSTASAAVEAKLNAVIAALQAGGLMEP
jgi:hypothetical protein